MRSACLADRIHKAFVKQGLNVQIHFGAAVNHKKPQLFHYCHKTAGFVKLYYHLI